MSDKMILLPSDAAIYRNPLFELGKPVLLSEEQYNKCWPLVDKNWQHRSPVVIQKLLQWRIKVDYDRCWTENGKNLWYYNM